MEDAIHEARKNPGTVVLNFLTDKEEDVFPMIPGGQTIHDMVLDKSHQKVAVPTREGLSEAVETALAGKDNEAWCDDIEAGKIK